MHLLTRVIEDELPLFDFDQEVAADRRVAWLCRIDLLREMGRLTEALAWSCLECELHPDNVAARALKEQLKRLFRFGDGPPTTPSERRRSHVQWSGLAGMRELRATLERDVILPLRMPRVYATMLFFDEFDALVPSRDGVTHEHYAQAVNEFFVQLNECHSQRLFVVAATNLVEKIDPAVLRPGRMDKHIFVGPPDLEARVELFRLYLAGRPVAGIDYLRLGEVSASYTPAEIEHVVNEAARKALGESRSICQEDLIWSLGERPPSLGDATTRASRIGFRPGPQTRPSDAD